MVASEQLPVLIKGCKIHREEDGLAMSSRNSRLTDAHRKVAPMIFKTLQEVQEKFTLEPVESILKWVEDEFQKQPLLSLEYFTIADEKTLKNCVHKDPKTQYRAFIAVFAGEIRLIDNVPL